MDLYERLGTRRGAGSSEIRRAWQRLSRALHPALNPGDPVAAERYRDAALAFEVLSDPQRRGAYDRGELPAAPVEPPAEGGFEGFDFSARLRIDTVGFREIFDSAVRPGPGRGASPGEELEQATRLSFEESMTGAARRVHLVRFDPCAACRGAGEVAFGPVPCPRCRGGGTVRGSRGHMIFSRPCGDCGGDGEIRRRSCDRCDGEGRGVASEWLDVRIPPGLFRREGDDLHCIVSVGMVEAAMGGHVEVPTPDGPVTIEVPAGTQNGQRFRLRKRGVPRLAGGGRGDLWAEAQVVIPAATDDRARALLRELATVLPRS
jgi:molecular chaperone DnaJ